MYASGAGPLGTAGASRVALSLTLPPAAGGGGGPPPAPPPQAGATFRLFLVFADESAGAALGAPRCNASGALSWAAAAEARVCGATAVAAAAGWAGLSLAVEAAAVPAAAAGAEVPPVPPLKSVAYQPEPLS